jgi:hypothetical protein
MLLTYKQLHRVTFPVYPLPSDDWYSQDGLLFVDSTIVDDKNMPGETLGIRRLQTPFRDLLPLKHALTSEIGIIKQHKTPYIDSAGKVFLYDKTRFVPLRYSKIKRVDRKGVASLLRLHGVASPFIIPRPPKLEHKWAGVLYLDNAPWLLYEYACEKKKDTRRKV